MLTEIVYLNHDNTIDLILKADGAAVDLSSVTRMTVTFDAITLASTNQAADPILWVQVGYERGEVHLILGDANVPAKSYKNVYLVVYDSIYTDGIVWGSFNVKILPEVEVL